MALTDEELRARWKTTQGNVIADRIRRQLVGRGPLEPIFAASLLPGKEEVAPRFDLRGIDLKGIDLRKAVLDGVDLSFADLSGAKLDGASFTGVIALSACFREASLKRVSATSANFFSSDFSSANLKNAQLSDTSLVETRMFKTNLEMANLERAHLFDADIREANLSIARLAGASLAGARLDGADLTGTDLTNVHFEKTSIAGTRFGYNKFGDDHSSLFDGTDSMMISQRDRFLSWTQIRFIGTLPLFGVSWATFVLSLATINLIGALNKLQTLTGLMEPIPFPAGIRLALLGSVLSVIGSTAYRLACPDRVQAFSEAEWVEEHKQPRLLYLLSSWSRKKLQWLAVAPTVVGSGILLYLVWRRVLTAVKYLAETFP